MLHGYFVYISLFFLILFGSIHCGKDIRSQNLSKQSSPQAISNAKNASVPTSTTWAVSTYRKKFSYTHAKDYCESKGLRLPSGEELKQAFIDEVSGFREDVIYFSGDIRHGGANGCANYTEVFGIGFFKDGIERWEVVGLLAPDFNWKYDRYGVRCVDPKKSPTVKLILFQ
jgi:hypothetical protein